MAYDVNKKDGTLLVTVADGAVDSSATTIKLLGRGVTNYGEIMAENLVWMMENFANTSSPSNPLEGQLWFDTTSDTMNVRAGGAWRPIGSVIVATTAPAGPNQEGDLWWDSDDDQLYGWDGSMWVLIGPTSSDPNIAQDATMIGINLDPGPGQMLLVIVDGEIVAAWSDAAYVVGDYLNNVATINVGGTNINVDVPASFPSGVLPGLNLNVTDLSAGPAVFNGTAIMSQYADIAERFSASEAIEKGSLVKLCEHGDHEVEMTTEQADQDVFGVVSTAPAYMMNAMAGTDETHPYIALSGRVPVKVLGKVRKGQRLVSSSIAGVARGATSDDMLKTYAIFGRALERKDTDEVSTIEAVVGVK